MAEASRTARRSGEPPSPHGLPYPDALHAHLDAAASAAASLATADEAGQAPTPTELVERYGGNEGVNATESEVIDND